MIVPDEYREFFVGAAGASGALIGLLFVAVSVFPERARHPEYQARASTALVLFTNALVLSLAGLVPDIDLGWWAASASVIVLVFGAATARLLVSAGQRGSLGLVFALIVVAGFEFWAGVRLIGDTGNLGPIKILDYVVISDLLIGIARAWQLVNRRDTGLFSSLRVLARGDDHPDTKES